MAGESEPIPVPESVLPPEEEVFQEAETIDRPVPASEPVPLPVEAEKVNESVSVKKAPAPAEKEVETLLVSEPAPPSGVSLAQTPPVEPADKASEAAASDIPPEYVYQYDPFAEIAPTALARVSRAVNCARANRETRPAFCPEYDEDQAFLASLSQNRVEGWEQAQYDPVADIAAARSAFGAFSAAQAKPTFTGKSESFERTHPHDQVLPDKGCRYISYGFNDPFQLDKGATELENRSVVCDQ